MSDDAARLGIVPQAVPAMSQLPLMVLFSLPTNDYHKRDCDKTRFDFDTGGGIPVARLRAERSRLKVRMSKAAAISILWETSCVCKLWSQLDQPNSSPDCSVRQTCPPQPLFRAYPGLSAHRSSHKPQVYDIVVVEARQRLLSTIGDDQVVTASGVVLSQPTSLNHLSIYCLYALKPPRRSAGLVTERGVPAEGMGCC